MNPYARFAAMIGVSTLVIFGFMYLNTYEVDHVFFSETRAYIVLAGSLWLVRSQSTVEDVLIADLEAKR